MKYLTPLFLGICMLFFSCSSKEVQQESIETFEVTSPIVIDTSLQTDYVAEIKAVQNVEIRARVKGYLEKNFVDEGKSVKKGQLLFTIYNPELNEEVAKGKAIVHSMATELKAAELALSNVKKLVEKNIVSKTELALAENKVELATAKVEEAKANESFAKIQLTYTQIKAPFSGIINRLPIKSGSLLEEGTLLTTISQNEDVFAYFDVSEKEYLDYADNLKRTAPSGNNVTLLLANGEEHPSKGRIETSDGEIDPNTGNIAFRARFNNPDKLLKHGASGKVRLLKRYRNALIVPQKATFEIQDRIYVFVVDKMNKVKTRAITTSKRLPHFYLIDAGLTTQDQVIYEGIQNLRDGMSIKPSFVKMKDIMNKLSKED